MSTVTLSTSQVTPNGTPSQELEQARLDLKTALTNLESSINKISNPYLARDIVKGIKESTDLLDYNNAISFDIEGISQDVLFLIDEINRKIKEAVSLSEHSDQEVESVKTQIDRLCTSATDELKKKYVPALVTGFTDALNGSVKWNFIIRFNAKQTMVKIDLDKLKQWIENPNSSFGELIENHTFVVPDALNKSLDKIRDVALSILNSPYSAKLSECVTQLNAQAANIEIDADSIATQLIERIEATTSAKLAELDTNEKNRLVSVFSRLFSIPANQALSDQEIDQKVRSMFAFLAGNPKISAQALAQQIEHLWDFKETNLQSNLLIDFSEFFARNNPYKRTLAEVLIDVLTTGQTAGLVGKAIVYRRIDAPISIKIDRAQASIAESEIKVSSKDDESITLKVNETEKKVEVLTYRRLVPEGLKSKIDQMTKDYQGTSQAIKLAERPFRIDMKTHIKGVTNPFKPSVEYVFEKPKVHGAGLLSSGSTEYTFSALGKKHPVISIKIYKNGQFSIDEKEQGINWESYIDLFHGLSWSDEVLLSAGNSLNTNILSLEQEPLATEGAIKKAVREKKAFKSSIIEGLLARLKSKDKDVQEAIKWINKNRIPLLNLNVFNKVFKDDKNFINLCTNSFVLSEHNVEKNQSLSTDQKRELACDLLHELQTVDITYLDPEQQVESQDIISQLLEVIKLTDPMKGVKGIGLTGPTGCGKSTSGGKLIGVPMGFFEQHGFTRVRALPFKSEEEYPVPRIGTSIGLSETLFTRAYGFYPPPPFVADPSNPFVTAPQHYPNFASGLTKENLKIIDFPGFFDTRGTDVEIVTNFSIDRAIDSLGAVVAMFQVISAETFENNKGQQIYSSLKDLEVKFPHLLEDEELQKRFHFLITKAPNGFDKASIRSWLVEVINNYRSQGLSGERYYTFVLNQLDSGRLHLVDPKSATNRLEILNSVISSYSSTSDPIKEQYQGGFNTLSMQFKLGSVIEGALNRATNLLDFFLKKQKSITGIGVTLDKLISKIEKAKKKADDSKKKIDYLNSNPDDISIQSGAMTEVEKQLKTQIKDTKESIELLKGEIQSLEDENKTKSDRVNDLDKTIENLSTGTTEPEYLYDRINRKKGDKVSFSGTWKKHVDVEAKTRRAVDRGTDGELSEHEGEVESRSHTRTIGENSYRCSQAAVIQKEFELVPSSMSESEKLKKLNELAGGVGHRHVFLDDGVGWRIDIDSAGEIEFYNVAIHDSGKKIMYGFKEVCNSKPPYPKLLISAVLPKSVFNAKEIENLRSERTRLMHEITANNERIAIKNGRIAEYETSLEQLQKSLNSSVKDKLISAWTAQKGVVAGLEKDKVAEEKKLQREKVALRRLAVSIHREMKGIEGTHRCMKYFKPTNQTNESIQAKNQQVLERSGKFSRMYTNNIDKIRIDVETIINEAIEIEF